MRQDTLLVKCRRNLAPSCPTESRAALKITEVPATGEVDRWLKTMKAETVKLLLRVSLVDVKNPNKDQPRSSICNNSFEPRSIRTRGE